MKSLRLVLRQNKAHYRKEHSWRNRLTYPLPPASTIIGAIHSACGWKEYVPMDISINGKYQSINNEVHTMHVYQDNIMDDRGFFVKVCDQDVIYGRPIYISEALKRQGSSHLKQIDTILYRPDLLEEYEKLKAKRDSLNAEKKEKDAEFKAQLAKIKEQKKSLDKKSDEYKALLEKEKSVKKEKVSTEYTDKITDVANEIGKYKTLVKTPQNMEVLSGVELIIYIKTDDESMLDTIMENVYNIDHIGRTEDSVEVVSAEIVELKTPDEAKIKGDIFSYKDYVSYVKQELIGENVYPMEKSGEMMGTVYFINKNYEIIDDKRIFNRVPTLLISKYSIERDSEGVWVDNINDTSVAVTFI